MLSCAPLSLTNGAPRQKTRARVCVCVRLRLRLRVCLHRLQSEYFSFIVSYIETGGVVFENSSSVEPKM